MALVIERRCGLNSSKCFADTCLKQENDLREFIKPRLSMALVIERRCGLNSSKCFADTCLKQENDLREIRLCTSLSTLLQLEASTN